jgi:putative hydrolase of the HAD superfamily
MFPFDVILFDVGGVLLSNGWDHCERARVLERFGLDAVAFESRHLEPDRAWESGFITADAYLDATVFIEPRSFTHQEFLAAICAQSRLLLDGALEILKKLSASGKYMVGALNNEARETNAYRFEHFGLRPLFKVALSSCYLGLRKPDPAIYERALEILGRPAERILFIDDRMENLASAEETGMKILHFTGAGALRQDMANLGVLEVG